MNQEPVIISPAQWPEARSFERLYHGNPEVQAKFVQALLGFKAVLMWHDNQNGSGLVDDLIREFTHHFSDYLTPHSAKDLDSELLTDDYLPDERLLSFLPEDILNNE